MSSNPCVIPTKPDDADGDNRWLSIHKRFLQECTEKDPESEKITKKTCFGALQCCPKLSFLVLFIGDDILEGLSFTEVYRNFEEMHLLNFSIRGDKTQNILWRLKEGELENIKPKVSCRYSLYKCNCIQECLLVLDYNFTLRNQQQPHKFSRGSG